MATLDFVCKLMDFRGVNLRNALYIAIYLQKPSLPQGDSVSEPLQLHWLAQPLWLVVGKHPNPGFYFLYVIIPKNQSHGAGLPPEPLQVASSQVVKGIDILCDITWERGPATKDAVTNGVEIYDG